MSTSASAAVQEPYVTEHGKFKKIRSVTDIDWGRPLYEQLEPNLKGGPRSPFPVLLVTCPCSLIRHLRLEAKSTGVVGFHQI